MFIRQHVFPRQKNTFRSVYSYMNTSVTSECEIFKAHRIYLNSPLLSLQQLTQIEKEEQLLRT